MSALPAELPTLPAWNTPVIATSLVLAPGPVPVSIYADELWHLAPLVANPSATRPHLDWARFPEALRPQVQLAAWKMINMPLPASMLAGHPTWHSRLGPHGIHDTVLRWQRFALWLHHQGVTGLDQISDGVWVAWADRVARQPGAHRGTVTKDLVALTRLWAFDSATRAGAGMAMPPWNHLGVDDFLPTTPIPGRGENTTEPISPATMGPLLICALRMVDDFADDILAAWTESQRLADIAAHTAASPASKARLKHYLQDLIARGQPVPSRSNAGNVHALANTYIAGHVGCSSAQVNGLLTAAPWQHLLAYVRENPGPCPLSTPITGLVGERRWAAFIDFTATRELLRHLGTACFIVLAYLTGMRPAEVLGLESGCCPDQDGGRHLIYGRVFKSAADADGNHHSAGHLREVPWVAIAPWSQLSACWNGSPPTAGCCSTRRRTPSRTLPPRRRPPSGKKGCAGASRPLQPGPPPWPGAWAATTRSSPTIRTARSAWPASAAPWPGTSRAARAAWWHWPFSTGTCAPR
ncbi:hypothetical protein AB0D13_23845 [Streptomyces sp. NPDC048430]|uniref:hypothetical protein n=1 Tax=Streptomyces sp. NPDC048430 TaxID=3155388 RepID=UPI00343AB98C